MEKKLRDILISVKYGPHLSTLEKGETWYLKGNHFDEDNQLNEFSDSYAKTDKRTNKFLLTEANVILAAKGHRNFAWAYKPRYGKCIASSLFYVLEVDNRQILSEYLALSLNAPKIQHELKLIGLGATVPSIPKKELLRLTIGCPSLEDQQRIIELNNLMEQQIELEKKIVVQRKLLKQGLIDLLTK